MQYRTCLNRHLVSTGRESENGLIPVMGGTYRDRFVRTPAGWRFSRKELEHHIAGDMALKNGR